ncbi:hypothetical protein IT570_09995 [Candidatus Sumerlaeota bacterium]|nr:hypothetical protein [Candidatus Sumerlaeota bacterium]
MPRRLHFSHPARFAFALIAAGMIGFLIELGSLREKSEKELNRTLLATGDLHYAAEAERFFLPDDFVRAGPALRRIRTTKRLPRFEPLLRAVAERGADTLEEEAQRRLVNRLSQPERITMILLHFQGEQIPGGITPNRDDGLRVAEKLLTEENLAAIRRLAEDPRLLESTPGADGVRADLNFDEKENREKLYHVIQERLLGGSEIEFRRFAADFAEDPPVKPLSFARQLVLTKEMEFLFLIGRGEKALPRAQGLLDGYFIRNPILRERLEQRIDASAKKAQHGAKE